MVVGGTGKGKGQASMKRSVTNAAHYPSPAKNAPSKTHLLDRLVTLIIAILIRIAIAITITLITAIIIITITPTSSFQEHSLAVLAGFPSTTGTSGGGISLTFIVRGSKGFVFRVRVGRFGIGRSVSRSEETHDG